jgi:hypothetical protein
MTQPFSLSPDRKFIVSSGNLPRIKIGSGLQRIDLDKFVQALNKRVAQSPTAFSSLSWAASEGIVLYGINTANTTSRFGSKALRYDGFANYPGVETPGKLFKNNPSVPFEIEAFINIGSLTLGGVVNYDDMVSTCGCTLFPFMWIQLKPNASRIS